MIVSTNKVSRNVLFIEHDMPTKDWEQWYLLRSDAHHDSKFCDWEFEQKHLERAKELDAGILDFGDLFDAMQGHHDPRRMYSDMREEYALKLIGEDTSYFDVILDDAANFYGPHADRIKLLGRGNHESSIERHNDINLTERLAQLIKERTGTSVNTGGYGGYVKFMFESYSPVVLKYFHGSGAADAAVTRGVISTNRQAVYLPDADIVVNGHNHESWIVPVTRERISTRGSISLDLQYHVRTPTYKDEYRDGSGGWHVERGGAPKPIGAVWMKMTAENGKIRLNFSQDLK